MTKLSKILNFFILEPGGMLAKNSLFNLCGQAIPMIVAVATIPLVIRGLGTERFGLLTIAWMVVGYFSLFDMGIGRATTKFVAEQIARGEADVVRAMFWTALIMLVFFGCLGGLALSFLTPWLVKEVLNIPLSLQTETQMAFYLLAISIPFVICSAGTRGILEGLHQFLIVNAIKIPASMATYILPLAVLPFSQSLYPIVGALVASRILIFGVYFHYSKKFLPGLNRRVNLRMSHVAELLHYGAWLTVSNVVSPALVYMDRFFIGSILTLSAVAYYVTPYEVITKLLIVSSSLTGVLFPVFAGYAVGQRVRLVQLKNRAVIVLALFLVPLIVAIVVFAHPLLSLWLGSEFATNSSSVLQLLAVGVAINSFALVPFTVIQALGRPDMTAKLHLLELPIYIALLWFLVHRMGVVGVALAWLLRVGIDMICLFWLSNWVLSTDPVEENAISTSHV